MSLVLHRPERKMRQNFTKKIKIFHNSFFWWCKSTLFIFYIRKSWACPNLTASGKEAV